MFIVIAKDVFFEGNDESYIYDTKEEATDCFDYYKKTNRVILYEAKEIENNDKKNKRGV